MSDDNTLPADPFGHQPWIVDGVSDEAIAKAEFECKRRGLTLAEWVEEAIERALLEEKSSHPL